MTQTLAGMPRLRLLFAAIAGLIAAAAGSPVAAWGAGPAAGDLRPGCHPEWPVVVHHAGARVTEAPSGLRAVACAVEIGYAASETSLAATTDATLVYSPAQTENSVARSSDQGATWNLAYPANEQFTSLWNTTDPVVVADRRTGRTFWLHATGDLRTTPGVSENSPLPNAIQTIVAYAHGFQVHASTNDGRDWTTADYSHENMGDWGKIFVGPAVPASTGAPQPSGYPDVVYVCANAPVEVSGPGRQCYRSLDGGGTFSSAGFVFPSATAPPDVCPALASNTGVVASDGVTYQPVSCSQGAYVAVSRDEGATYTFAPVRDAPPATGLSGSLQLAIDEADNLYGLWVSDDRLQLAVSRDGARTWSAPMDVTGPGLHNITRPAFAGGGVGQVGITYYASRDPSAQTLSAYITQTRDALDPTPLFFTGVLNDPAHPIYQDAGVSGGSPRADYVGGTYDPAGTFWAGVVKRLGPPDANGNVATTGYVGRLAFWRSGAAGLVPAARGGHSGCVRARRLVFGISRIPHGRVVRVLVYINGHLRLQRRGRNLTRIGVHGPPGPVLHITIVTVDNHGGRLIRRLTLRTCTRTGAAGESIAGTRRNLKKAAAFSAKETDERYARSSRSSLRGRPTIPSP